MSMLASAGFNAVAPDWIGHGSSDKPAPGPAFDYSSAAYIKELENFVSAQGMTEPFALIVHVSDEKCPLLFEDWRCWH